MSMTPYTHSGVLISKAENTNYTCKTTTGDYQVYLQLTITTGSEAGMVLGFSGSYQLPEKYSPHFLCEADARAFIDRCLDINTDYDGTGTFSNTIEVVN